MYLRGDYMSNVTTANRDIKSLQPLAQQAAQLFLDTCKARGIDIFVTEYHRSQERQNYLYEQGRSRPGNIVTWTRSSNHTSGYAWDIAVNPPHDLYDSKIIARAGQVAMELGIEWGGTWKEQDTPHFQVNKNWKAPREEEKVEKQKINLNGVIKEVEVIKQGDYNFVKLQDLRDDKIVVGYDEKNKLPVVKVVG